MFFLKNTSNIIKGGSNLIKDRKQMELLQRGFDKHFELTLIYKGTRDGFNQEKFFSLCEGISDTLCAV